jgi:hypothetical protein
MHRADLEGLVDASLKALPPPPAPVTLLPRVMAAVDACSRRPWYSRGWLSWPVGWQAASVAALVALVVVITLLLPAARGAAYDTVSTAAASTLGGGLLPAVERASGTVRRTAAAVDAIWLLWRVVFTPVIAYALGLVVLMCLVCVAFGTALNYLAFGKALPR